MLLFASRTDTFGQVILEAQASGLPAVAVAEGGPSSLIEDGETGRLVAPTAQALSDAVISIIASPLTRARLRRNALNAVRGRTWESSLEQLATGYAAALQRAPQSDRKVA